MYCSEQQVQSYLQFVYPEGVSVWFETDPPKPSFSSFMTTNATGTNAYFHIFRYYEKVHLKTLAKEHFNSKDKKIKQKERKNTLQPHGQVIENRNFKVNDLDASDDDEMAFAGNDDLKGNMVKDEMRKKCLPSLADPKALNKEFCKKIKRADTSDDQLYYDPVNLESAKSTPNFDMQKLASQSVEIKKDPPKFGDPSQEKAKAKAKRAERERDFSEQKLQEIVEEKTVVSEDDLKIPIISDHKTSSGSDKSQTGSSGSFSDRGESNRTWVPVSIVIQTECEYHDIFREILISLFDLIRVPKKIQNNENMVEHKWLAYAEFIAHIAFLKTIPCPSFNTRFNIEFLGKTLIVNEQMFHKVPNKSQVSIQVLFDILDVTTILNCWKALLFDYTLVVISSQASVQFYVADALKQLLFPLTWQNSHVQPCGKALKEFAFECILPLLFCLDSSQFEYETVKEELIEKGDCAILDVDGNFMNSEDLKLPKLSNEATVLRTLNQIKNKRVSKYDLAYPDISEANEDDFVTEVRQYFISMFNPYLRKIDKCFKQDVIKSAKTGEKEAKLIFEQYFDSKMYMRPFEDEPDEDFARGLLRSAQFVHFCDDRIDCESTEGSDLNNYKLFESYLNQGQVAFQGEMTKQDEEDEFNQNLEEAFGNKIEPRGTATRYDESVREMSNPRQLFAKKSVAAEWPPLKQVVIDWRMPFDNQRVMLFDKLEYLLMHHQTYPKDNKEDSIRRSITTLAETETPLASQSKVKVVEEESEQQQTAVQKHYQKYVNQINTEEQYFQNESSQLPRAIQRLRKIKELYHEILPVYKEQLTRIGWFKKSELVDQKCSVSDDQSSTNMMPGQFVVDSENQGQDMKSSSNASNNLNVPEFSSSNRPTIGEDSKSSQHNKSLDSDHISKKWTRIKKLAYGAEGFLDFFDLLFSLLKEKDQKEMGQINYYFALKVLLDRMENDSVEQKEKTDVNFVDPQEKRSEPKEKKSNKSKTPNTPRRNVPQQVQQNKNTMCQSVHEGILTTFDEQNLASSVWMAPQEWHNNKSSLARTYQMIQLKVSSYSAFEPFEDKLSLVLQELLYWPKSQEIIFPRIRFNAVLRNLTKEQKSTYLSKIKEYILTSHNQYCAPKLLETNRHAASKNTTNDHSLDDTIFCKIDILKSIEEREKKKEVDAKAAQQAKSSASRPQSTVIPLSQQQLGMSKSSSQQLPAKQQMLSQRESINEKLKTQQKKEKEQGLMSRIFSRNTKKEKPSETKAKSGAIPPQPTMSTIPEIKEFQQLQQSASCRKDVIAQSVELKSVGMKDLEVRESTLRQQSSKYSLGDAFLQHQQRNSIVPNQLEVESEADQKAEKLLKTIIKFFSDNEKHLTIVRAANGKGLSGSFDKKKIEQLQDELAVIKKKGDKLKYKDLIFGAFKDEPNTVLQCFWLNILNFMILLKLAELLICQPNAIKKLQNYSMWQALLDSTTIYISEVKITAFQVFHAILRQNAEMPLYGEFMLQKHGEEKIHAKIKNLIVQKPNPFLMFGMYMPIDNMPVLQIFTKANFQQQLKQAVQVQSAERIKVRNGNFLVRLPRYIEWFRGQFDQASNLEDLLEFFLEKEIVAKDTFDYDNLCQVLGQIKTGRKDNGHLQHIFEFEAFSWQICLINLIDNIKSNASRLTESQMTFDE